MPAIIGLSSSVLPSLSTIDANITASSKVRLFFLASKRMVSVIFSSNVSVNTFTIAPTVASLGTIYVSGNMYPSFATLRNSDSGISRSLAIFAATSSTRHPSKVVIQLSAIPCVNSCAIFFASIDRWRRNSPACKLVSSPNIFTTIKNAVALRIRFLSDKFVAITLTPSPDFTENSIGVISRASTARTPSFHHRMPDTITTATTSRNVPALNPIVLLDFM